MQATSLPGGRRRFSPESAARWSLAFALVALVGCSTRTTVPVAVEEGPRATSPAGAVKRFEWAFVHRDLAGTAALLADDFEYFTAGTDSAGNPTRRPVGRDSTLLALRAMFEGAPGYPPADVKLVFDRNLVAMPDPRPGYPDSLYAMIRTSIDLTILDPQPQVTYEVTGYLLFHLVRGDAALLPADQVALGAHPDPGRWWIQRIEDETIAHEALRMSANPKSTSTLGRILALYRARMLE